MKKASGVLAGLGCKKTRRGAGMEGWLTVAHTYHAGALWAGSCTINWQPGCWNRTSRQTWTHDRLQIGCNPCHLSAQVSACTCVGGLDLCVPVYPAQPFDKCRTVNWWFWPLYTPERCTV